MDLKRFIIVLIIIIAASSYSIVTIDPSNTDIKYTGVIDKISSASGMELYRLKKSYIDANSAGYWSNKNAGTQAGITIQIKTASPTVSFNFDLNSSYEDRYARIVLHRNGTEIKNTQGGVGTSLSISATASSAGSAIWTCILPSFKAQYFKNIELDDGYTLEPITSNKLPVYVAIGNSITHGVGQDASETALTYAWQVADNLGYELYNFAVGGSKINTQILDNFSDISPDLITVLWGYNDVNSPWDLSKAMAKYDTLMTSLVTTYTNTKIVAIEQTYTTTTTGSQVPENSIDRLRSEQLAILKNLQKTYKNLFIVSGQNYTDGTSLNDAVHLNNKGAEDLANGLINEIKTFTLDSINLVKSDTIILRSEYEKVGDTLATIPAFKSLITDSSDLSNVSVSSSGNIIVTVEINDLKYSTHSIVLTAEQTTGDTLKMQIVDGIDYWLSQHGGTTLNNHQDLAKKGEWAAYNNLWGTGTAIPNTDFRIEIAYNESLPDSTLFVWDVPSEAADFGGSSVWNFSNLMWGNRYGSRDDLVGFPFKLNNYDSLILDIDYTTIHDEGEHKVALNMFTTKADTLAPFTENRGDFFMTFDQKGTWVPPYPDTLNNDTTLMGSSFILLHKEDIKNLNPYHYRRAIIKNNEVVEKGTIDLMQLFTRFNSDGYMDLNLSTPNIQIGIEVTDGLGAIRFNKLSVIAKDSGETKMTQLMATKSINVKHDVKGNILKVTTKSNKAKMLSIINLQGKVVKETKRTNDENIKIDISNLPSGVYISKLKLENERVIYQNFIKR